MKTYSFSDSNEPGQPRARSELANPGGGYSLPGTILLLSSDVGFHHALRDATNNLGRILVQTESLAGAITILHAMGPSVVILDLDLAPKVSWEVADALLADERCPPIVLVNGDREPMSGSIANKGADPGRLLQIIDETVRERRSNDTGRNAIRRDLIHRLRPGGGTSSVAGAHRFWGINE